MHLCKAVTRPPPQQGYDTKQFDDQVPVMLERWGMQSTPSLPSLQGPLWSGEVAIDRVLSMGQNKPGVVAPESVLSLTQIEQFDI